MGNLIKEWIKRILVEEVKQEVVVYAGRFQPFHAGHYATYEHLVKKFGKQNVFVGTSNQQGGPRHPFNFKEKREIMMKMFNIPSSQIVQVKNPYQPSEVLNKFDSKTTAFITVVGEKDEARLGGKYFKKYDGKPESGYIDQGYVYVSPMQKNSISGTDVRNWLSASDDSQRKAGFKKAYPKFDPKIYNLISTRLMKIESVMESFFKSFDIKSLLEGSEYGAEAGEPDTMFVLPGKTRKLGVKNPGQKDDMWFVNGGWTQMHFPVADVIVSKDAKGSSDYYQYSSKRNIRNNTDLDIPPVSNDFTSAKQGRKQVDVQDLKTEGSTMGAISLDMVDNGPAFSWASKEQYEKANNEIAKRLGFEVVDWILGTDLETQFVQDRPTQVSYYPKSNRPANRDYSDWKSDIEKTATAVGIEFINFLDKKEIGLNEDLFGTSLKLKPYETLMVKSVVAFMMDKFNFKAKIIVKKKEKAGMMGDISLNSNSVDGNKFYLHFNPNQSYKRIIQSMIHELTHVKQVSKNELLPNKDYTAILWKGKEYIGAKEYGRLMKTDVASYVKLPWEVEANSNMTSLYPQFIKSKYWLELKGKDDTLDYIINTNENTLNEDENRISKKPGQHTGSSKHSDLYTDENPVGTISGLKFATVEDAEKSVNKIKSSGKSHAHKIQAAIAMEQRAKAAGKVTAAGVYRSYINSIKKSENFNPLLVEGGAYGHMAHPFDTEMNLTFGDLKQIIGGALNGELELAREKTDGQALAISWRDDMGLIAARNKGHLANRGEKALDISGVASKFGGRGGLTDAYNFAMKDLTSAIKGLSKAQRDKIFKQGAKFMNLEVIWPTSVNVIPYGQALLIFHNTTEYNEAGVAIGSDQSDAKILAGMIKQINQTIQSQYTIQGPPVAQLPKSQKLTSLKSKFDGQLSKLQKQFNLKDTDGVAEYHQKWWENFVDTKSPSTLDNKTKMGLVKRWAFYDKGFRLDSKNIEDPKVLSWAQGIDKNDHAKIQKDNIRPFEDIFLGVGSEVLSFMSSVITANPDMAVRSMKDRLDQTVKDVQKGGDPKKIAKLKLELERLAAIGGKEKIVPNEGIVFVYKGNTYKLTGTFAPLNQILGLFYGE